jgi:hypothetical protein
MKCPHCGHEILNGEDFSLEAPTRAKLVRATKRTIGNGPEAISIPAIGGDVAICASMIFEWSEVYTAVDVPATLKEIRQWVLANERRKKVNVRAFVVNWLKRAQDEYERPTRRDVRG